VGVEPTIRPAKDRIAGFEDRGDHRTPFASASSIEEAQADPQGKSVELLLAICAVVNYLLSQRALLVFRFLGHNVNVHGGRLAEEAVHGR